MQRLHWTVLALGTIASFLSLPSARADILVSNLDQPERSATPIAELEYWGAQSFTTDGNAFVVSSIAAIVGNGLNAPLVVAELRRATGAELEIDTTPAGLVETFTAPDMSGALTDRVFLPDNALTLDPLTTYWFVLGSGNTGTYEWGYADTNFFSGPGSLGRFADSSDGGATWNHYPAGADFPFFIEVNGTTAIPEPAAGLTALAGMAAGLLVRCRRRAL